jgi:hypothetical protein
MVSSRTKIARKEVGDEGVTAYYPQPLSAKKEPGTHTSAQLACDGTQEPESILQNP